MEHGIFTSSVHLERCIPNCLSHQFSSHGPSKSPNPDKTLSTDYDVGKLSHSGWLRETLEAQWSLEGAGGSSNLSQAYLLDKNNLWSKLNSSYQSPWSNLFLEGTGHLCSLSLHFSLFEVFKNARLPGLPRPSRDSEHAMSIKLLQKTTL